MKHFWALPALLRLALASQQFNVFTDLVAFPQYEVTFADNVISEEHAESRYQNAARLSSTLASASPQTTPNGALNEVSPGNRVNQIPEGLGKLEDVAGYEYMVSNGQRYLCSIPRLEEEENEPPSNHTKEEQERELARATERGWQLLKGMEGSCIYFVSGWWSYSFCFNDGVRQFHQLPPGRNVPAHPPVEDKTVSSYVLGKFERQEQKKLDGKKDTQATAETGIGMPKMRTKGEQRYLVQDLKGGTECDLTGKERRIEVQFQCEPTPSDRISLIKETATCQYLMVISTPRLCSDVAFLPPQQKMPNQLSCTRVLPAASIPSFLAEREREAEAADLAADKMLDNILDRIEAADGLVSDEELAAVAIANGQVVGDVLVGGHVLIPKGKRIEKSSIVGGGKEVFVATIAKSSGYIASEEDLKKINIKNARRDIERVKNEMEKVAKGKPWRLDVVETARGRELRGIVDSDDDASQGKDGDGKAKPGEGRGEALANDREARQQQFVVEVQNREHGPADEDDGEREQEGSEEYYYKEEL